MSDVGTVLDIGSLDITPVSMRFGLYAKIYCISASGYLFVVYKFINLESFTLPNQSRASDAYQSKYR